VKTAETRSELEEVLKLRYEVFHREFLNKRFPYGIDIDRFDRLADHLVIVDRRVAKIVGTYRLISSHYSQVFYSQSEFSVDGLLNTPGVKLELSRACIQRDYRTGAVMNLLWRGISQYLQETNAKFLFGMASVRTMDAGEVSQIFKYLSETGNVDLSYQIAPTSDYQFPGFETPEALANHGTASLQTEALKALLPPLFNSYLKMGAKICSAPALDRDFRCADFFTVLKVSELAKLYERKYAPC
jgi:putative hemolysin